MADSCDNDERGEGKYVYCPWKSKEHDDHKGDSLIPAPFNTALECYEKNECSGSDDKTFKFLNRIFALDSGNFSNSKNAKYSFFSNNSFSWIIVTVADVIIFLLLYLVFKKMIR